MNEIIKIRKQDGRNVVSARDLYLYLTDDSTMSNFNHWGMRNIASNDFAIKDVDYQIIRYHNEGNRQMVDYALTIDFAKKLSMMARTLQGEAARTYFIDCEKELIGQVKLPTTYIEALEALIKSEKNKLLLQENINQLEPKAEVYDKIVACENLKTISEVAKLLNTGQNRFFEWLRGAKILMTNNLPYQQYVEQGYLVVKTHPIATLKKDYSQTYFTAKGEVWITKRYLKD